MSMEARNRTIEAWFKRFETRQTVLPRFQRFEAWSHANVAQLFNTLIRGLPIGSLLVLEIGNSEPFISRPIKGAPSDGERVSEHLLDGQQRVTALWRGLHNNYDERTYFLNFKVDDESGAPYYVDSIARWRHDGEADRRPVWANSPVQQWKKKMIPLDLCAPGESNHQRFRAWIREAIENQDERDEVIDAVSAIRSKFAAFNLPYLSLPVDTPKETALDVFIKMNTSAAPLSIYDIVVAQVEARMGESLHELVAAARERCPQITEYYDLEELTLYAGALMQSRAPINTTYMEKDFGLRLRDNWDAFLRGVVKTVEFLEEERVFDAQRLPSDITIPVLVALWSAVPNSPDAEGRARTLLRRYMWRAFFTNRYEKSTSSRSLVDHNDLARRISGMAGKDAAIFDDAAHPLPTVDELMTAGWPKKKDRLARAILSIALRQGGLDLADGSTASRGNLHRREYHHLFPDGHLKRNGVDDNRIYLSLNCALVTWRTNRAISDKDPERYLAERRDGSDIGESEIRARLASHIVPFDALDAGDYEAFLSSRAKLVHDAMIKICAGAATL